MQRLFCSLVLVATSLTSGSSILSSQQNTQQRPRPGAAKGAPGHVWHMKRVAYRQNTSLQALPMWGIAARQGRDVDAVSMLVPTDWTFQAGPAPGLLDCNMSAGRVVIFTASPDKTSGVAIVPGKASMWSNDRGLLQSVQADNQRFKNQLCVIEEPQPLAQRINGILHNLNKDAQVMGPMEPIPGLSEKLPEMMAQANGSLAQQGSHVEATAGRVPVHEMAHGGTLEGFFSVLQVIRTDRMPNGATVVTTDYPMQVATFAPQGQYAEMEPMYQAMLDSVVVDPDYAELSAQVSANILSIHQQTKQRLNQIAANIASDNANAARTQASIRAGAQAYANQVHRNVAANRSAALDHSAQQFSLYMGDQAIYKDPSTGQRVQMSSQYDHAWASTTGNTNEYILTDSPSFDPNGKVGSGSWTQLQQER